MKTNEVRKRFIDFYRTRGHAIINSAPLIPENDPTTLFTGSGMQPLVPYLLGQKHPLGVRLANSQKAFRTADIEDIGDNRHTTFFEMLGNWSLGDYFKKEQLPWVFEFLTKEIGIDPKRLYVTVFAGDEKNNIPRDMESVKIWKELFAGVGIEASDVEILNEDNGSKVGMQGGRIFYYDAKKNWWSRSGVPENMPVGEPGGPDSEIFYEFTNVPHDNKFGKECHPNCDCGRFLEIGNSVFMEYKKTERSFEFLPQKNVDFGGGLERISAVSENYSDVFLIDSLFKIISKMEEVSGLLYSTGTHTKQFRVVADHIRAAVFLIGDGVLPSNVDQGYFVRRLLRRAIRFAHDLKIETLVPLIDPIIENYRDAYQNLFYKKQNIIDEIKREEEKFKVSLEKGLREFEKIANERDHLSGKEIFDLYQTFGFPFEVTKELALDRKMKIDEDGFKVELKKHQDLSRSGSEQKFKGGLSSTGVMEVKYHTATHLLNAALKKILGEGVSQKGSNITPERMRFDFSYPNKMTDEQKRSVEQFVNDQIKKFLPVTCAEMSLLDAKDSGAIGVFGDKYGEMVKVYSIGDDNNGIISKELCGGPHVENTGVLGEFKILKEEAVSQGVRRIKAVLN